MLTTLLAAALALSGAPAHPTPVIFQEVHRIDVPITSESSFPTQVPRFDPAKGVLLGVDVRYDIVSQATAFGFNGTTAPAQWWISMYSLLYMASPASPTVAPPYTYWPTFGSGTIEPNSSWSVTTPPFWDASPWSPVAPIAPFIGTQPVDVMLHLGTAPSWVTFTGNQYQPNWCAVSSTTGGRVFVRYRYRR